MSEKKEIFVTHWSDNCRVFSPLQKVTAVTKNLGMPFFYVEADSENDATKKLENRIKEIFGEKTDIEITETPKLCKARPAFIRILGIHNGKDIFAGGV